MTHGGKRLGAGRKATRQPTTRRVAVYLDQAEAAKLAQLQKALALTASDVLRRALSLLG